MRRIRTLKDKTIFGELRDAGFEPRPVRDKTGTIVEWEIHRHGACIGLIGHAECSGWYAVTPDAERLPQNFPRPVHAARALQAGARNRGA